MGESPSKRTYGPNDPPRLTPSLIRRSPNSPGQGAPPYVTSVQFCSAAIPRRSLTNSWIMYGTAAISSGRASSRAVSTRCAVIGRTAFHMYAVFLIHMAWNAVQSPRRWYQGRRLNDVSPGPSRVYDMSARWVRNSGLGTPVDPEECRITAVLSGLRSGQRKKNLDSELLPNEHRGSGRQFTSFRCKMSPTVGRMLGVSP
jgi:hypothetical protein